MADYSNHDLDEVGRKHRPASECQHACESGGQSASPRSTSTLYPTSLLRSEGIGGRGNSQARAASMQAMQQTHGNRAVQRFVQRTTAQQTVPVQRTGLSDIWDYITKGSSADGDAIQSGRPPTPDRPPVGPVLTPDYVPVPRTRVGPVLTPDYVPVPGMPEQWPDSDSWV